MAQNANAINEPSTDEILTSIREIIEEFTVSQLSEETEKVEPITNVKNVANTSVKKEKGFVVPNISQIINSLSTNGSPATVEFEEKKLTDEINTSREERLSVDEAMNALARRIGLNVTQEPKENQAVKERQVKQQADEIITVEEAVKEELTAKVIAPKELKPETVVKEVPEAEALINEKPKAETSETKVIDEKKTNSLSKDSKNDTLENKTENKMKAEIQFIIADEKFFEQAETLVDGIIRPVLRNWLEKNLNTMMERILRDEVQKSLKLD